MAFEVVDSGATLMILHRKNCIKIVTEPISVIANINVTATLRNYVIKDAEFRELELKIGQPGAWDDPEFECFFWGGMKEILNR